MFNERDNVERLAERMSALCSSLPDLDLEFVVVDDGSTDGCMEELERLVEPTIRLRTVTFSRNFGAHAAITAGLRASTGDAVTLMGADLQEPITLYVEMVERWRAGVPVVWAIREQRAQRSLGKLLSIMFWRVLHRYSTVKGYPPEGPSIALCDRAVVDAVNRLAERNRNILLLIAWVGFRSETVKFVQAERVGGESKWTFRKLAKTAADSMVQFSTAPMRFMTYLGFALGGLGFLYALFLIVRSLLFTRGPEGWTTVIVATLIIEGCSS